VRGFVIRAEMHYYTTRVGLLFVQKVTIVYYSCSYSSW